MHVAVDDGASAAEEFIVVVREIFIALGVLSSIPHPPLTSVPLFTLVTPLQRSHLTRLCVIVCAEAFR